MSLITSRVCASRVARGGGEPNEGQLSLGDLPASLRLSMARFPTHTHSLINNLPCHACLGSPLPAHTIVSTNLLLTLTRTGFEALTVTFPELAHHCYMILKLYMLGYYSSCIEILGPRIQGGSKCLCVPLVTRTIAFGRPQNVM